MPPDPAHAKVRPVLSRGGALGVPSHSPTARLHGLIHSAQPVIGIGELAQNAWVFAFGEPQRFENLNGLREPPGSNQRLKPNRGEKCAFDVTAADFGESVDDRRQAPPSCLIVSARKRNERLCHGQDDLEPSSTKGGVQPLRLVFHA